MRLVGKLLGRKQVAPAQLDAVDAHLARGLLDQPLDEVIAFRAAGTAVRAGRHGVGQHAFDVIVDRRHAISRGRHLGDHGERDHRRGADRHRADVGEHLHAQRQDASLAIERERRRIVLVARHVRGEEFFAALGAPFHRAAELARRVADQRVLRREPGLHAEAAADVAVHQPELGRLGAEHRGEQIACRGRRLILRIQRGAAGLVHADRAARLHGHGIQPLVVQLNPANVGCAMERFVDRRCITVASFGGNVCARRLPQQRRARLDRLARIDHARQIFIVDDEAVGGVLRLLARLGDDRRHRLADVEHLALGERRARRRGHRRAVGALEQRRKRDVLHAVGAQVRHRPCGNNAVSLLCF